MTDAIYILATTSEYKSGSFKDNGIKFRGGSNKTTSSSPKRAAVAATKATAAAPNRASKQQ
jgi:hypothetical protein